MTALLRDVLHEQADALDHPMVDLDTVMRDGDRRVRRNRAVGAVGAAALVVATVGGLSLVDLGGDGADGLDSGFATPGATGSWSRTLTYGVGSTIYGGGEEFDAGAPIASYVATDDGFVFTVESGDVMFGSTDGSDPVKIGSTSTDGHYLKSDDTGSLVAWVEFPKGGDASLVVYDTSTRAELLRDVEDTDPGDNAFRDAKNPVYVYAVDDGSVYWHNGAGAVRTDVATARTTVLDADANPFGISDVANGQLAYIPGSSSDVEGGYIVGPSLTEGVPMKQQGNAYLSPEATYVSFEDADELVVKETATAEDVTPANPGGYEYWVVYQWVDDHTAGVFGIKQVPQGDVPDDAEYGLEFLTCDIPSGACTVQGERSVDLNQLRLPVGESF